MSLISVVKWLLGLCDDTEHSDRSKLFFGCTAEWKCWSGLDMHLMPCSNGLQYIYTFNSSNFGKNYSEICGFSDEGMNSVYFMAYLVQGIYI